MKLYNPYLVFIVLVLGLILVLNIARDFSCLNTNRLNTVQTTTNHPPYNIQHSADVHESFCEFLWSSNDSLTESDFSCNNFAKEDRWAKYFDEVPSGSVSDEDWKRFSDDYGWRCVLPYHPVDHPRYTRYQEVLHRNIDYWKSPAAKESENPKARLKYFMGFWERIQTYGFDPSLVNNTDKIVANIAGGPYGGMVEAMVDAVGLKPLKRLQIDIFMRELTTLHLRNFTETCFVTSPCEAIDMPSKSVDLLLGFNSIDHGWSFSLCLKEIARIAKEAYVSFDVRPISPPYHMQIITWEKVENVVSELNTPNVNVTLHRTEIMRGDGGMSVVAEVSIHAP